MKHSKLLMVLIVFSLFLGACATNNKQTNPTKPNEENPISSAPNQTENINSYNQNQNEASTNSVEENSDRKPREGKLDLDNIEIVNVDEELVETITSFFKTIENNDYQAHSEFMYDPSLADLSLIGPYILAVTKLEADQTRLAAVIDEYSLKEISEDIEIVKVTMVTSVLNGESSNTGDFIFLKSNKEWKLYKIQ